MRSAKAQGGDFMFIHASKGIEGLVGGFNFFHKGRFV
jgi:hypothetical protein